MICKISWKKLISLSVPFVFLAMVFSCPGFSAGKEGDSVVKPVSQQFVLPFKLDMDTMERLLVADFKGDPEFQSFEPQVFDDPVNGKGMRFLRYRKDGKVDIYWEPGIRPYPHNNTLGTGFGDLVETSFQSSYFEFTERGVKVDVAFTDAQGRRVSLQIMENTRRKPGFPLLAPVSSDMEKPSKLFLVYMLGTDLVRRPGTKVVARVGDRPLKPATLPLLRHGRRVFFIRYSTMPVLAGLNPPMDRPVVFNLSSAGTAETDGMRIHTNQAGKVTQIAIGDGHRRAEMDFKPGFPNLNDLPQDSTVTGKWSIKVSGALITGGSYQLIRQGNQVKVELKPTRPWDPSRVPFSVRVFTRVVSSFRKWPMTYRWHGIVELGDTPTMSGVWERIKR